MEKQMTEEATKGLELLIIPVFYLYFKPCKRAAPTAKNKYPADINNIFVKRTVKLQV